ncbi:sigma factor [Paenibacillus sp. UNC451MF]
MQSPTFSNRTQNREEAEDLAQDIMLQLLKSITSYVWTNERAG